MAFLRALDLTITYAYTPDLSGEWNPVVSFLGGSWTGLIAAQLAILGLVAVSAYFYFARPPLAPMPPKLSFRDFTYVYFFGTLHGWPKRLYALPRNWRQILASHGFVLTVAALLVSAFAIVHNALLVWRWRPYETFVLARHGLYFPSVFVLAALAPYVYFFAREYRRYRERAAEGSAR
jgi:hypothetical protein